MLRWSVAGLLLVLCGLLHGLTINRWEQTNHVASAVARLENVPMTIGNWHGQTQEGLGTRELAIAAIEGYLSRIYVNQTTNQRVRVLLVCGRSGPISVHTPDICFQGAGFATLTAPAGYPSEPVPSCQAEFFMSKFGKESTSGSAYLRVCWSWSADGRWLAPSNPRWQFGGQGALYKLYLIQELAAPDEGAQTDACLKFMPELMPVLEQSLFSTV